MKTSEVFKLVKENLGQLREGDWSGSPYICVTLRKLEAENTIEEKDRLRCKNIIGRLLDGYYTLDSWLKASGYLKDELGSYPYSFETEDKLYNTRQGWLDWLIQKYQSQND
jgi:hypothetical protein